MVVGVVATLLGLALPAIFSARTEAQRVSALVNQREAARVVDLYVNDYELAYPCFGSARTMGASFGWRGDKRHFDWWQQPEYWGWFVASLGYDGHTSQGNGSTEAVFLEAGDCPGCGFSGRSIHWLSATLFADPELFVEGAVVDKRWHRGIAAHEVTRPADKAILYQFYFPVTGSAATEPRRPVHFADGHGEQLHASRIARGPDNHLPLASIPTMNTYMGVLGSDRMTHAESSWRGAKETSGSR